MENYSGFVNLNRRCYSQRANRAKLKILRTIFADNTMIAWDEHDVFDIFAALPTKLAT